MSFFFFKTDFYLIKMIFPWMIITLFFFRPIYAVLFSMDVDIVFCRALINVLK